MTADRYGVLYTAARDWAEAEAAACGEGALPAWEPPFRGALDIARVVEAPTVEDIELVLRIAADSWDWLRRYWTT